MKEERFFLILVGYEDIDKDIALKEKKIVESEDTKRR